MTILDLAGAIGGGNDVGIGAALDVNIVTEDDQAYIASNATVDAAQNVEVTSSTNGTFNSITAAAGPWRVGGDRRRGLDRGHLADDERLYRPVTRRSTPRRHSGSGEPPGGDQHDRRPAERERSRQPSAPRFRRSSIPSTPTRTLARTTRSRPRELRARSRSSNPDDPGETTPFSGVAVVAATSQNLQTIAAGGSARCG